MNRLRSIAFRLVVISAIWVCAITGYFMLFSTVNGLSYNKEPLTIALYFLGWSAIGIAYLRHIRGEYLITGVRLWRYTFISLLFGLAMSAFLYLFSLFPSISGPAFAPYTDLVLATPWYFLPKAVEILLQQTLIAVLVIELSHWLVTIPKISFAYAVSFGGMHIGYALFTRMPIQYAAAIIGGAFASSFIFPYLILRVRGGIVYAYAIHLLYYIVLALLLHAWPPPGYSLG